MKKLSRILTLSMILIMLLGANTFAASDILLSVDGKKVDTDVAAFIENGRTLVPVRFISEALGKKVEWDAGEKKVTIIDEGKSEVAKIELKIASDIASLYDKDGNKKENKLDVAAKIVNDRTFVPVRFIAESLGVNVDWDNDNRVVIIGDKAKYSKDEFAKLRQAEPKKETKAETKTAPVKEAGYISVDATAMIYILQEEINPQKYIISFFEIKEEVDEPIFLSAISGNYDPSKNALVSTDGEDTMEFKFTDYGIITEGAPFIRIKEDAEYDEKDNKIYENGKVIFDIDKFLQNQ